MNNEAELAAVLGHEVGHVAARHSARRQQTAQRNQLLGVLGSVLSGVLLGDSGWASSASRSPPPAAPQLADAQLFAQPGDRGRPARRAVPRRAGYDPRAMATVLQSLAAQNSLDAAVAGPRCDDPGMGIDPPRSGRPRAERAALAGNAPA
jgi:predicted Zn-dependent protease